MQINIYLFKVAKKDNFFAILLIDYNIKIQECHIQGNAKIYMAYLSVITSVDNYGYSLGFRSLISKYIVAIATSLFLNGRTCFH